MLQLLADEEVAIVTAGPEAQQQAADKLQAAQAALAAVDQVCVMCPNTAWPSHCCHSLFGSGEALCPGVCVQLGYATC